jgi:hypothetical protein
MIRTRSRRYEVEDELTADANSFYDALSFQLAEFANGFKNLSIAISQDDAFLSCCEPISFRFGVEG